MRSSSRPSSAFLRAATRAFGSSAKWATFPPTYGRCTRAPREDRRINFTGIVPSERTAEQLAEIDVLVVPSTWYENSPTTILLAFAAGVPVIASDVPGITEIVGRGDNALLFKVGDAGQLADCMRSVVEDPRLLSRLRANAAGLRTVEDSVDEALELYDVLRATPRANGTPAQNGAGDDERNPLDAGGDERVRRPSGRPRQAAVEPPTRAAGALRFAASASGCEVGRRERVRRSRRSRRESSGGRRSWSPAGRDPAPRG